MSYVFFPGCSMDGTAWDYGRSARAVMQALGVRMPDLEDWTCCGSSPGHQTDPLLAAALAVKNLSVARQSTIAVGCAACYGRLKAANHELLQRPELRAKVADVLGAEYDGATPVRHLLEILVHEVGTASIESSVVRPLSDLKVACYYGCLLVRPPEVTHFDDPDNPTLMDRVLSAAGAQVIDWPHKTECCGAGFGITEPDIVRGLAREILDMARAAGADCVATACPLCQLNLDLRQRSLEQATGERYRLPIFYFTQLLGLALGFSRRELGLGALLVNPLPLLPEKGLEAR